MTQPEELNVGGERVPRLGCTVCQNALHCDKRHPKATRKERSSYSMEGLSMVMH